jgi:hypothetical protein
MCVTIRASMMYVQTFAHAAWDAATGDQSTQTKNQLIRSNGALTAFK